MLEHFKKQLIAKALPPRPPDRTIPAHIVARTAELDKQIADARLELAYLDHKVQEIRRMARLEMVQRQAEVLVRRELQ